MRTTTLDEKISVETANSVREYCSEADLTLDEFLLAGLNALLAREDFLQRCITAFEEGYYGENDTDP